MPKILFDESIKDFLRLEDQKPEISNEKNREKSEKNEEILMKMIKKSPKLQVFRFFLNFFTKNRFF